MRMIAWFVQSSKAKLTLIISFFVASFFTWFVLWLYSQYNISTDDAYVNANVIQITPQISGKILKLNVLNNQHVNKGEILLIIDPEPFQAAFDSAKAQVKIAEANLAKATGVAQFSRENETAISSLKTALAELQFARASLKQATLHLQYTTILAPMSGWVTSLAIRAGDIAPVNQPLFALVGDDDFWVDANFKETEMENIKRGQRATIITDLYPHHPFVGMIESISSGSEAFSLLPPQNSLSNFPKVIQRIPVRIRILNPDPNHQLRVGISATVTVKINSLAEKKTRIAQRN